MTTPNIVLHWAVPGREAAKVNVNGVWKINNSLNLTFMNITWIIKLMKINPGLNFLICINVNMEHLAKSFYIPQTYFLQTVCLPAFLSGLFFILFSAFLYPTDQKISCVKLTLEDFYKLPHYNHHLGLICEDGCIVNILRK